MKTIAAILVSQKKDLVIDEIEIPRLDFGKVLVKIKATRICGSQLGEIDGVKGDDPYLPHLLGHEAGGVVLEVGEGVRRVKPGDHVVCHWRISSGIAGPLPRYSWNNSHVNTGHISTFSEYSVISENRLTPIPTGTEFDLAALLADTITTGFGIINNDAQLKIGQSIVVFGIGGIGSGVIIGAKLAGAFPIIAVDIQKNKLEIIKRHGATHVVDANSLSSQKEILSILKGKGADVTVDGTGDPKVIKRCFNISSKTGRTILFGVPNYKSSISFNTLPLHFGKTITGSEGGCSAPEEDIPRYLNLFENNHFGYKDLITHRTKLVDINSSIEIMRKGASMHTMIEF